MQTFKEYLNRREMRQWLVNNGYNPEYALDEGLGKLWNKAKPWLAGAVTAGAMMAPGYTMNPEPEDYTGTASYAQFMDPVAQKAFQKQLDALQKGEEIPHEENPEGTQVYGLTTMKTSGGEDHLPGSNNVLASKGSKTGLNLIYPDGFGGKHDPVSTRVWRTPFSTQEPKLKDQAKNQILDQLRRKHQKDAGMDFSKATHADTSDFTVRRH